MRLFQDPPVPTLTGVKRKNRPIHPLRHLQMHSGLANPDDPIRSVKRRHGVRICTIDLLQPRPLDTFTENWVAQGGLQEMVSISSPAPYPKKLITSKKIIILNQVVSDVGRILNIYLPPFPLENRFGI